MSNDGYGYSGAGGAPPGYYADDPFGEIHPYDPGAGGAPMSTMDGSTGMAPVGAPEATPVAPGPKKPTAPPPPWLTEAIWGKGGGIINDAFKAPPTAAPPMQPMARGPMAPRPPALPEGLQPQHGGLYYPEGYAGQVMEAFERGELSADQVTQALDRYKKHRESPMGLLQRQDELQMRGLRNQIGAQRDAMAIDAKYGGQAANAQTIADLHEARIMQERAKAQEVFQAEQEKRIGAMEKLSTELQSIDPDRYWKNKHPAQMVLSALAVGLGGFVEGYTGGKVKNRAIEMIDQAIARDIDAQKADISNKRQSLNDMRGIYAMARERFQDDEQAALYSVAQLQRQAAQMARRYESMARDEKQKIAAQQLADHYDLASQQNALAAQMRAAQVSEQIAMARMRGGAGAAPGVKRMSPGDQARYVQALGGFASDAKTAAELNAGFAAASTINGVIGEMKKLRLEGSTGNPLSQDRAKYDALRTKLMLTINKAAGAGALDKGSLELYDKMIPEAALFSFDSNAATSLDTLQQSVNQELRDKANNVVVVPAEMAAAAPTKTGEYAPQYVVTPNAQPKGNVQFKPGQ